MIQDVLAFAKTQVEQGKKVALTTVTDTQGSSPASPGQMMAILSDGTSVGTVGGGTTEHLVIQQAIAALHANQRVFRFSLNHADNGMICGGGMAGFGNILGNEQHLVIFGGGHIGQSLAPLAAASGFYVTVVEDRPELANHFSLVRYVVCTPDAYADKLPLDESSYVVICTRGHKTDDDALRFCLSRPLPYVGMIGSLKKVGQLFAALRQEGYSQQALDDIYAPIGLTIASGAPAEIAIAILAEILLVKNKGRLAHRRLLDYTPPVAPQG